VLHLQEVVRGLLDVLSNLVTVSGAVKERSQDEHVKGALEDGRALLCLFRHRRDSTLDLALIVGIRPSVCQRGTVENGYQGPMAAAQPNERLALILVQRQYAYDKTALQSHEDAVASYGKLMDGLAALHAKLTQEAGQKASLTEIGKQTAPIVESLKTILSDMQSR
jgi:hypothetical protein